MIIKFEDLSRADLIQDAIYESGNFNNAKDEPLIHLFKLDGCKKGLGSSGGFRRANKENNGKVQSNNTAFVALLDTTKQNEWPNINNKEQGTYIYYGDNRTSENDVCNTKLSGNKLLTDIFNKSYGTVEDRQTIPPIFIFQSTGKRRDTKFIGLAVPGVMEKSIEETLILKDFGTYKNYVAHFTILKISDNFIKRDWLKDLKDVNTILSYSAPKEWNEYILNGLNNNRTDENYKEIEIREDNSENLTNETERKIKIRVTQGKFRESLLMRDKKCVICGLDIKDLLIASHIKPWSKSDIYEKVDENNGILLCANHDALFDKGYISFDDKKICICEKISILNYNKLNINENIKISLNKKQAEYMKFHLQNIFKY